MTTTADIHTQIRELEQKLEELRKAADAQRAQEKIGAINQINELIATYDVTAQELNFPKAAKGRKASSVKLTKATSIPKYRDPATGATWTGKGKPPAWIRDAANRDDFLIKS
ncbi:H-NS histone family protein [Burkholderia sp. LMG 21824]|uniref:H-NS histone family protein n=1 Tax=Burkholderia sp. LMG 21824 TaxID=3158172 RepID=UPI003C302453